MQEIQKYTLQALLKSSAECFGDKTALSFIDIQGYTYRDLYVKARELSFFLHCSGIEKGDKVAVFSENNPNWGLAYFSIAWMGAVNVPILPDFTEIEVKNILEHSETKAIFVSKKLMARCNLETFQDKFLIIVLDDFSLPFDTEHQTIERFLRERLEEALHFEPLQVEDDDLAAIIYTSGTTGKSKGVMLSNKNLIFDVIQSLTLVNINSEDRFLSILPLSHTYECSLGLILPVMQGSTVYYLDKPPSASYLLPAIQKVKPTAMLTVPLIMEKIYKSQILPKFTGNKVTKMIYSVPLLRKLLNRLVGMKLYKIFGGCIRFYGIGGAPLSPEVERFLHEARFPYAIGYGLTETSPMIAGCSPAETKLYSTGYVMKDVEVKIDNPNPETGEGEILVRGHNVMKGYFKDKLLTLNAFTHDGWFRTGDLGVFDKDRYLFIKGRLKNMILGPSGENIYPEEIEAIINKIEGVVESVVYEKKGRLIAKVHVNYDELEESYNNLKQSAINWQNQMQSKISDMMVEIQEKVNKQVSKFSRLSLVVEQVEPFEKTPTQKIKRYLYID
ncbi:MAG: AMP-binding protein [Bacteroidota bacterium]|nr:AMP-binding protein [Bacteroidota bacterium]MDP4225314.1 AMP-binding protein [Bacteroidota bacterium]MDP4273829.1 AMP-binding protein [Bacteroidota bacterium]